MVFFAIISSMKNGDKMKKLEILVVFGVLLLDQITKIVVQTTMQVRDSIEIIEGFFSITYVQNTGAAWSMLEGQMWLFYIITVVALAAMVYFFKDTKEHQWWLRLAILLMVAGTLGNFIDRLTLQYVRDFLDFIIFGYDFPVFNVADISLCIGVGMIAIETLFSKEDADGNK